MRYGRSLIGPLPCVSIVCFIKSVLPSSEELEAKMSMYSNIKSASGFRNFGSTPGNSNESTSFLKSSFLTSSSVITFSCSVFCERTGSVNKNSATPFLCE